MAGMQATGLHGNSGIDEFVRVINAQHDFINEMHDQIELLKAQNMRNGPSRDQEKKKDLVEQK